MTVEELLAENNSLLIEHTSLLTDQSSTVVQSVDVIAMIGMFVAFGIGFIAGMYR